MSKFDTIKNKNNYGQAYLVMSYLNGVNRQPVIYAVEYFGDNKFKYYSNVGLLNTINVSYPTDFGGPYTQTIFVPIDLPIEIVQKITLY